MALAFLSQSPNMRHCVGLDNNLSARSYTESQLQGESCSDGLDVSQV